MKIVVLEVYCYAATDEAARALAGHIEMLALDTVTSEVAPQGGILTETSEAREATEQEVHELDGT